MIPFSPPYIDEKIIEEVTKALRSGWITTGPRTKEFEQEIARYVGIQNVLAVNSWTAGAEMILNWYGIKAGDEVIIPAYTYCATANIIIHCGAKPIMVDVDENFCISIDAIKAAITPKTKAIISVDIGGLPVDYNGINQIINSPEALSLFIPTNDKQSTLGRILFISDAAHSFGATYDNKFVGALSDFTVFSFHAVKNLTTAEGGAICITMPSKFNNKELYNTLNTLSLHGQNKDALAKSQKGAWEYDVLEAGFKCNMTDILASIGLVEIRRYKNISLPYRRNIFNKYTTAFKNTDWATLPTFKDAIKETSYHLFLLRIKNITLEQRNQIIKNIFEKEVSVNVHYKPLPLLTFYKNEGYDIIDYPISESLWEQEITLPVYVGLSDEDINIIIQAVINSYHEVIS